MKSKPDLALDSSSTGGRVRSQKQRSGAGPSESTDSSGSSLDLTAEVENPSHAVADVAPPSVEVDRFLSLGPLSSIGVEEVANWRPKYHLSDDIIIRILGPVDRNLGDLEGLTIVVAEVMYSYAITPLNGGEQRYHLHPRGGELPVQEIVKKEKKRLPVFNDIPCVDPSLGEKTIKQVLELPIERRQVRCRDPKVRKHWRCLGKIFHEEITPASGFQVPASRSRVPPSGFQVPAPGSGSLPSGLGPRPRVWVLPPASRPSDLSCLRTNGNLPLIRFLNLKKGGETSMTRAHQFYSRQDKALHLEDHLHQHAHNGRIPATTIHQMKIYAHCSTSTTLLTGSGHDLQLISRVTPCSLKYIDTSCSLQHTDRSTICSSHVPSRTDDSCPLELRAPKAKCPLGHVPTKATCSQGYVPI
ncbi:hypothetical protein F2Q69_00005858 [Brassica cretica]|uniref:Uncharacterized protein n=1 Tax=Brassica cretica TaxID=69181 RepID=A0A8S9PGM6_BRACR|nr:hypothetical protein F2Q69_00005858 [Brassica cretica]